MSDLALPNDSQLVARCLRDDAAAWRTLVQRYQRLVYAVACRAGLDEHAAADVFQTVFSRLVQALPGIAQPDRLQAWIVTTAKREAWLQVRRARRTVSMTTLPDGDEADDGASLVADAADPSPLAEDVLDELQQLHLLRLALDRLDARCHGLLTLLFADESDRLPYKEIAIKLDLPAGSIGPTRARCLGKLRALLEG